MSHEWKVVKEKTEEHWLELVGLQFGNIWRSVSVKWDGCIHFCGHNNVPKDLRNPGEDSENDYYIHICDIDEMIDDLQEIKRLAREHFGDKEAWAERRG